MKHGDTSTHETVIISHETNLEKITRLRMSHRNPKRDSNLGPFDIEAPVLRLIQELCVEEKHI